MAARNAQGLHRVGHHHRHFGVRRDIRRADDIGVELHELAEAARARLLVAEDVARAVAAIGLGQALVILRHMAGERRGQIIAQGQPLLVVVLKREDAFVRPVGIGQELAERIGEFEGGRLDRREPISFVDPPYGGEHRLLGPQIGRLAIDEAARQTGGDPFRFLLFRHRPKPRLVFCSLEESAARPPLPNAGDEEA